MMISKQKNKKMNIKKNLGPKKTINKKQTKKNEIKKKKEIDNEEIISSESEQSEKNNEVINEDYDEETADQKRLRLAKKFLNEAKINRQIDTDDFFIARKDDDELSLEENKQEFIGVIRDNENEDILLNKALQRDLLKKAGKIYSEYGNQLKEKYQENNGKFEEIVLKGHTQCITCSKFDHSGNFLYSASKDSSIIKWDLQENKKILMNLGKNKNPEGHYDQILTMDLNYDSKMLITAGQDRMIKLWDTRNNSLITTLKGHRDTITGVKFQNNSNVFATISYDRSFKMWDGDERAYMDTFYGHTNYINNIDSIANEDFVTCSFDKTAIYWKINTATQLVFGGPNFSLDCIKTISNDTFITGSQDCNISLWNIRKKKPAFTINEPHEKCWITSLGNTQNSDVFASGAYNNLVNIYKVSEAKNSFEKIFDLPSIGIINDISFTQNDDKKLMAIIEGDEHKLGRWITKKAKNQIRIYKLL